MKWTFASLMAASCIASLSLLQGPLTAEESANPTGDLDAIKKSADEFIAAYEGGNASAIANLFAEAAEFVDGQGNVFHGRAEIEEEFAAYFSASGQNKIEVDMDTVRFVADGVLIEEGQTTVYPPESLPATRSQYVVTHIRQADGQWKIASLRTKAEQPLTPHENLEVLSWLVGSWVDESDEGVVKATWQWSDDGNYLLSDFQVIVEGQISLAGTQRIGWDPLRRRIRAWVFDNDGGFAESDWSQIDEVTWQVNARGVSSDGAEGSSTGTYTRLDKDRLVWTATNRIRGGEPQPDVAVTVVRSAPEPGAPEVEPAARE